MSPPKEARVPGYERDWGEKFDENLAYVLKQFGLE
jgi:hypothetical protein